MNSRPGPEAQVDRVIDENGEPVVLQEGARLGDGPNTTEPLGATGPTGWWRLGLVALAVLVAIVLLIQLLGGGSPAPTPPPR